MLDFTLHHPFYEIAVLILIAAFVGLFGLLLRQPLIVSFIAVGILAGPDALGLVSRTEYISLLSEMSIAVLLFLVGLKLDLKLVRTLGAVALATGLGQVTFTVVFGMLICMAMGMEWLPSLYVGIALTFSSTIIVVKLLSDKREIDSLHGRIALGFLIVQDIVVVLAMVVLSAIGVGAATDSGSGDILKVVGGGVAMIVFIVLFIRYLADPLIGRIARSPELLVVFAVGWAASLGALGDWLGFGMELGGLLAGVSLASTQFRDSISSRLASLRDFLLLFFFVSLGAGLDLSQLGEQTSRALVLSLFVLIGNPLIVLAIMGYMGYKKRTGFLAGLTVAQISEFSLIFMAMGVSIGHVADTYMGLVTLVGLVTIALSTYMITWSHHLYDWVEPWLRPFERKIPFREKDIQENDAGGTHEFILFGLGRYGRAIGRGLIAHGHSVLGVDFDPEAVTAWQKLGHDGLYGDATDPEFLGHLPLGSARVMISSVPSVSSGLGNTDPRLALLNGLREHGFRGKIAVAMRTDYDEAALKRQGADVVLSPFLDAATFAVTTVEKLLDDLNVTDTGGN
jgi:Kef-type K+ transport system membrane component KefB/voltage-gated potassium channel Kch